MRTAFRQYSSGRARIQQAAAAPGLLRPAPYPHLRAGGIVGGAPIPETGIMKRTLALVGRAARVVAVPLLVSIPLLVGRPEAPGMQPERKPLTLTQEQASAFA